MKKMTSCITMMLLLMASSAMAAKITTAPENPATGIWIQQVGELTPHASSKATLYYTKYSQTDRVKSISYQYNGAGYLLMKPSDKKTLCMTHDGLVGADGIVHHPDGDLMIAGQGTSVHKVSKTAKANGGKCLVATAKPAPGQGTNGFWHLMMDPTQKILWGAGIPGYLFRFSTEEKGDPKNTIADKGYKVDLKPSGQSRRKDDQLATIVWDGDGTAYFTYSDYLGGGCELTGPHQCANEWVRKDRVSGSYFGYFTDTTWVTVDAQNQSRYGGKIGDRVIASFGTKILLDSLEGAHGATYDSYSNTIFVFGGAKIVQIRPFRDSNGKPNAKVVAEINLREFFFDETELTGPRTDDGGLVGWRLDQGTVDGYGHLFVASNTGHLIFVDYVGNPNRLINDNVLVHVQWVDNFLDDVAPLMNVQVDRRDSAETGSDDILSSSSGGNSSMVEYVESSSSAKSSSSVNRSSSSSAKSSSSNGKTDISSSSNGKLSSSSGKDDGHSSGAETSSSSDGSDKPGSSSGISSGSNDKSSSSNGSDKSSSSNESAGSSSAGDESETSSSSANGSSDSGSGDASSSSRGDSGNSSAIDEDLNSSSSVGGGSGSRSSSSKNNGNGEDSEERSSSSNLYFGADDYEEDSGSDFDSYPSAEDFVQGDSIVSNVVSMIPVDANTPGSVIINGNHYLLNDNPKGNRMDLNYDSGLDSAKVGQVVAITLKPDKVKEFFGDVDSLKIISDSEISLVDPNGDKQKNLVVNNDGSVTIFVTAEKVVVGGAIKVVGGKDMVIIDNINFYDPIPETHVGYIKDLDGDNELDYLEVLMKDSLSKTYDLDSVWIVVNGKNILCKNPKLNDSRDRILVDVRDLELPGVGKFPKDATVLVSYTDGTGTGAVYYREAPIVEVGSFVIRDAFAIRNKNGLDSLFLQFNIDLIPVDVAHPEMLVMLKQEAERQGFDVDQVKKVYMPTKDIVILVAKEFGLKGKMKDSVSLYPNVTFSKLPYITSDEYDREVPVTVIDRFASAKNVEYQDTDKDGVLDQIVTVFDKKLTQKDIEETLYLSFPWYSSRGMMIYLQAQPGELKIDPNDSTRVIWNVRSATPLAKGVTSIREDLPDANVYTYYSVFGETFVNEEAAPLVDKMAPVVASATLGYGSKADTLSITFSEAILTKGLKGDDFFSYIHGGETLELKPTRIDWSADGFTAKLIIDGSVTTIMPGDSLVVRKGEKDAIKDNYGNIAGEKPQPVIIGGLLNHLVESTNMGSFDAEDDRVVDEDSSKTYTLQTVSSVNLRYLPGTTTKKDLEKEGALGQLVQLGERFVPQLIDRAHVSADGSYDPSVLDSLKPEDVYISFVVNYSDHLGQFVNDTVITVPCNSPKFGGNCLESDKKVFVNWNFKDHRGRFVGTGVYNVHFKMVARYEDKKIEEEIKDKWGVRRKKGSKRK